MERCSDLCLHRFGWLCSRVYKVPPADIHTFCFLCEILPARGDQCSKQLMLSWGPHTPKTQHFPKEISVIVEIVYVCSVHTVATSGYREVAKWLVILTNQVEILIHL